MRTLDLPRNLRTRARREAPADRASEVSRRARRRRRARRLARDLAGRAALGLDLDARRLRGVHRRDAAGLNPFSPKARELKRFFFNSSFDTELDSANRLMIPPTLMRYASLDKDVVVTGSGECLEVWDRARV